jgi:hypothetical protein
MFLITEVHNNPDKQEIIPPLLLTAKMGTRTRAGPCIYAALLVQQSFENDRVAKGNQCLLPYPQCEERGWKVILLTVMMSFIWLQPSI